MNHDGTSGTVDLFSKTTLSSDHTIHFSISSKYYNGSDLDNYLESIVYDGFTTEIRTALNLMDVASNGEIIQRHITAPSLREVGNSYNRYVLEEGTIYPIFSPACDPNPKSIFAKPNGVYDVYYWTRSRNTHRYDTDTVLLIDRYGSAYEYTYTSGFYVVARLRFAAK